MSNVITKAEFARQQGWAKSYVTKLGQADRLVLDENGRVIVDASLARIAATADPVKSATQEAGSDGVYAHDIHASRAKREHYNALQAEADYLRSIGQLVSLASVEEAGANMGATLRSALERLPVRLAPELALERDEARVRAMLADALDDALREISALMSALAAELVEASR